MTEVWNILIIDCNDAVAGTYATEALANAWLAYYTARGARCLYVKSARVKSTPPPRPVRKRR